MTDIALVYNETLRTFDVALDGAAPNLGFKTDETLRTAVVLSLFTDRRARSEDAPAGERLGWWADSTLRTTNDGLGSRLWLLQRATQIPDVLIRARDYAKEALQWMIDDGVVASVDVVTQFAYNPNALLIDVSLRRPEGDPVTLRFHKTWEAA